MLYSLAALIDLSLRPRIDSVTMSPKKTSKPRQNQQGPPWSARRKAARPRQSAVPTTNHSRTEEALPKSEYRHRTLVETLSVMTWSCPSSWHHVEPQPSWMTFTGQTAEEMLGAGWTRAVHPDDLPSTMQRWNDAVTKGEPFSDEHRIRRHDGEWRWMSVYAAPIREAGGSVLEWFGMHLDITVRKQSEEMLRTAQSKQQQLLASTPVVFYTCRATGDYGATFVSQNVLEQLGYSPQDVTEHADFWVNHIHPDDRQDVLAGLAKLSDHDQHVREYRFLHKNGTYRWLHDVVHLARSDGDKPVELVGFQIDVTQRKNAEEALRRSEGFTAAVVDHLPNMLFVKDARDLRFVRVNKAGEHLLGYSEHELVGKNDYDFFPVDEADFFTAKDREVLSSKRLVDIQEEPIKTRNGDRLLHTKKIPLLDREGRPQYLLGISEDITDRKLAEGVLEAKQLELARSQAQLRDLTGKLITAQETERRRIARELHDDFTQRLAALAIDLRYRSAPVPESDEPRSHRLDHLAETAEQLATDLQRLAHQLHPSILEHVGLEAAVREHAEEFATRTGLKTEVLVRKVPVTIPLDSATCLYRVLQESLQNVRKHAEATNILVRLLRTGRGIGLCIHDDGRGFDHAPEMTPSKGLGLTSMAERVKGLMGTFRVKTQLGDGTEIHAWVPLEPGDH